MTPAPLRFEGVWKAYPRWSAGSRTVRAILTRRVPVLGRRGEQRWALRDVSFRLEPGHSIGLIGANGAGKSTLLRLASGLGRATRGQIARTSNAAAVLSLGDTLDLALTGRENALTAALVAGLPAAEARARLPAMLEFAELEAFAEAPVRTYSDGMKLRLAFGVIAQLEPEALLLDEVLAVGDISFQEKCRARIHELRASGTAVLFASHSLDEVVEECDQVIWLQGGAVRAFGDSATVIDAYVDAMRSDTLERTPAPSGNGEDGAGLELRRNRFGSQELTIDSVRLEGRDGAASGRLSSGSALSVTLDLLPRLGPIPDPIVGVAIHRLGDALVCYDANTEGAGVRIGTVAERTSVTLAFERLDLLPGDYAIDVGVYQAQWEHAYDFHWQAYPLSVVGRATDKGVFRPPHHWVVRQPAD